MSKSAKKTYKKGFKEHRKNKTYKKELKGGKVVGSGGYGCVFRPALKCVGKRRSAKKITKLLKIKYAEDEFKEITRFKDVLKKVPKYNDYFLLDGIEMCTPDKLTKDDLGDFDAKCKALQKMGISKANMNAHLSKVMALNMPDGGVDMGDFIEKHNTYDDFKRINAAMQKLLLNGIIPMNKLSVYHCDIKESNILISVKEDGNACIARLIDWGLSTEYVSTNPLSIPEIMKDRPLQYNVPFSNILFNSTFAKMYADFLVKNPTPNYYDLRAFVTDYLFVWNKVRGPGHMKTINALFGKLFEDDLHHLSAEDKKMMIEMEFTYYYIVEYISQILLKYTKYQHFDLFGYFEIVFLKNIDIWGFIMSYYPLIVFLYQFYDKLTKKEIKLFKHLKYIFMKYLYENGAEPINTAELNDDLTKLGTMLESLNINKNSSASSNSNFSLHTSSVYDEELPTTTTSNLAKAIETTNTTTAKSSKTK